MENKTNKEPTREKEGSEPIIANKLLEFQKRVSAISKDSINPFFKSKYFDVNTVIDTIKPILNEVGLVVAQPLSILDGRNALSTEVWDGNKIILTSHVYLPDLPDAQKLGAAITYFRRYALVSLLLLQGEEDDDGNSVGTQKKVPNSNARPKDVSSSPEDFEGAPRAIKPITQAQAWKIKSLRTQKGLDQISDSELRELTSLDASNEIGRLQLLEDREMPE